MNVALPSAHLLHRAPSSHTLPPSHPQLKSRAFRVHLPHPPLHINRQVRNRVGPLLQEVKEGGLQTADGLSYLEAKHLLLLQYCMCIVVYLMLKAEGHSVKDHPVITRQGGGGGRRNLREAEAGGVGAVGARWRMFGGGFGGLEGGFRGQAWGWEAVGVTKQQGSSRRAQACLLVSNGAAVGCRNEISKLMQLQRLTCHCHVCSWNNTFNALSDGHFFGASVLTRLIPFSVHHTLLNMFCHIARGTAGWCSCVPS